MSRATESNPDGHRTGPADVAPDAIRLGTKAARQAVVTTKRIIDEMAEGARVVAGQRRAPSTTPPPRTVGLQAAVPAGRGPSAGPSPTPGADANGRGQADAGALFGQFVDLAQQLAQALTDTAARLLEVGAGPLERLVDPDPTVMEDLRVVMGPVAPGATADGSFVLCNSSAHDAEIGVVLTNPLASMNGVIPIERVAFDPRRLNVPGRGEAGVDVTVKVPKSASSGRYLGIIRSDEVPGLTVILEVDVT